MYAKIALLVALCAVAHAHPGLLLEKGPVAVIGGIAPVVKTAPQPIQTVITKAALPVWGVGKTIVQAQPISASPSLAVETAPIISKGLIAAPLLTKGGLGLGGLDGW